MNYYVHGDAAKAEQIKAAFEKLGIDVLDFGFADKTVVYCSIGGACVQSLPYSINLMHILHSHPGYKELKLPVEPKFKVGDWIVRGEGFVYEPSLITEIRDYYICELLNGERVTYTLNDVHKNFHLWTIEDAKDGDVIAFNNSPDVNLPLRWIGIYKQPRVVSNKSYWFHCIITPDYTFRGYDSWWVSNVHPATKEQRDLLFTKMKEAGYQWDEKKKELLKIKPHYAIANFQPFDKVLVRYYSTENWKCGLFSHLSTHSGAKFVCVSATYVQCIPYNDDTKHLLGTTDMPSEEYINW